MQPAIATQGLTKYYGRKCVVNSLDLHVPTGSVYGLLGRNGSGKSTTLKMLLGFVHPDRGSADLLGHNIAQLAPEVRARVAFTAEGHPFLRWMTVDEAVRFTRSFYPHWNSELLDQILDHFALPRRAKIRSLSNGQRAQVSLALAVAPDPELLILDDPTLGLDTVVRRDFLESLIQIIQREGRTILISSHILADVERVADRIGIMVDGVLRADCPTEYFKLSLRKVILEFAGEPPTFPACAGLVSSWRVGHRLEVVLVGYGTRHEQLIESLGPLSTDVLELSLEDAFIEYTRGPRRALPLLNVENRNVERTYA
ncbi:ABC transporter ATP-binding protein [Anatilimnocola floriformis]|uniref:ABC transporter ATP-binding protein n=1 Tax=Anatilimnocola floriformis TaxID=2948575 RepID=UPI0020C451CD|nr:ABC transporter ATP-binding protein [Anatilimnocola floriformis]